MLNWFKKETRRPLKRRVVIIGLDCAEPSLMFEKFAGQLPTLDRLRSQGAFGKLESVIPAITVPAWSCMTSGKDPGALGIYGFRNRSGYHYERFTIANGKAVLEPRLWDILSNYGKRSIVLNVPGTFPAHPINGEMVTCFLTPDAQSDFTYPLALRDEIHQITPEYPFDVKDFRTENKAWLIEQVTAMTKTHFATARHLAETRDWDFFMMVEIGLDRMHHALWAHMDSEHRHYVTNSPFQHAIRDYYQLLDAEIAQLMSACQKEGTETVFLVVSDHGGQRMEGGVCLNEWLIQEGYLVLKTPVNPSQGVVKFDQLDIDWSKTRAWGEGGYYGRLFLNIAGREPQGVIAPVDVPSVIEEIRQKLSAMTDDNGKLIGTRCFQPQELYAEVNGIPPDLLIYFGDLAWRSIGSVGWNRILVYENDTGPDDANHAQQGLILYYDPSQPLQGMELDGAHIQQVAPTVLDLLNIEIPKGMPKPSLRSLF